MRPGPHKRSRGRSNNHPHHQGQNGRKHLPLRLQTFDSNGPSVKIRGNAYQVFEKYMTLAREAALAGDRIAAENFFQHAEHYFRIINIDGPQPQRQHGNGSGNGEYEGQDQGEAEMSGQSNQSNRPDQSDGDEQPPEQRLPN